MDNDKDLDNELEQNNPVPSMDDLEKSMESELSMFTDLPNEEAIGQADDIQTDIVSENEIKAEDSNISQEESELLNETTEQDNINTSSDIQIQKETPFEEIQEPNEAQELITVRPVKFPEFEITEPNRAIKKNLDIMQDISMHISVELGRTKSTIKEVMDYKEGSIVELDKIAGEQVEVYVNNKLVAKGEVIVIEDKFGVRVTSTNLPKPIQ